MIALTRTRTATAIKAAYRGADKKDRDKELLFAQTAFLANSDNKIEFKSTFWKNSKPQLKKRK